MKKERIIFVLAFMLASCTTTRLSLPPTDKCEPTPILKTENITLNGESWVYRKITDKQVPIVKNRSVVLKIKNKDNTIGKIWTRFNNKGEILILNLPDNKGIIEISMDSSTEEFDKEIIERQKSEIEIKKKQILEGKTHPEKIAQFPYIWTFFDKKKNSKITVIFGYDDKNDVCIELAFNKNFFEWSGKYSINDTAILLYITEFREGNEEGVMGYQDLNHFVELKYLLNDDILIIEDSLSDALPFNIINNGKYKFPVPLELKKCKNE